MNDYYVVQSIIILPVTRQDNNVVAQLLLRIYITTSSNYNLIRIAVSFVVCCWTNYVSICRCKVWVE